MINEKKKPLSNISVNINSARFKTDTSGKYSGNIRKGIYNVSCNYPGYKIRNLDTRRYDSDTLIIDIELEIDSSYEARHKVDLENFKRENENDNTRLKDQKVIYDCFDRIDSTNEVQYIINSSRPRPIYLLIDTSTNKEFSKNIKLLLHSGKIFTFKVHVNIDKLYLTDRRGRVLTSVKASKGSKVSFDTSNIMNGTYFIVYIRGDKRISEKITL